MQSKDLQDLQNQVKVMQKLLASQTMTTNTSNKKDYLEPPSTQ